MEWISVEDRLPDSKGQWVLVYADGAMACLGYDSRRGFADWILSAALNVCIEGVTHWMPLPEPPEDE